jgi:hypothetical protein
MKSLAIAFALFIGVLANAFADELPALEAAYAGARTASIEASREAGAKMQELNALLDRAIKAEDPKLATGPEAERILQEVRASGERMAVADKAAAEAEKRIRAYFIQRDLEAGTGPSPIRCTSISIIRGIVETICK